MASWKLYWSATSAIAMRCSAAVMSLGRAEDRLAEPEMAAEDLRRASHALERLLGRMDAESVLDHLFSAFCIGK